MTKVVLLARVFTIYCKYCSPKNATCIGGKSVCQAENNVTSNSPIKSFTSVISSIYDWLLVATRYWRPIRNTLVFQTMPENVKCPKLVSRPRLKLSKWWTRKTIKIVSYFCFINRRSKNSWFLQRRVKKCECNFFYLGIACIQAKKN